MSDPAPVPEDWEDSIARFKERGLTAADLRTAWEAAAGKDNPWLYFCGVCWNMIHEMTPIGEVSIYD
jgi:hypothetical protein